MTQICKVLGTISEFLHTVRIDVLEHATGLRWVTNTHDRTDVAVSSIEYNTVFHSTHSFKRLTESQTILHIFEWNFSNNICNLPLIV